MSKIEVTTSGLTQMKTFASATQTIPEWAFPLVVEELRMIGVAAGKSYIKQNTGTGRHGPTGSMGILEESFMGLTHKINKEHLRVEIGSPEDYAEHVASGYPAKSGFNRDVQVLPFPVRVGYAPGGGGWRFIGNRAAVEGKPFMKATSDKIETELNPTITRVLAQGFQNAVQKGKGAPPTP